MTVPPANNSPYTIQQSTRPPRRRWLILLLTLLCCFFLLASCITLYVWLVLGKQFQLIWPGTDSVPRVGEFNVAIAGLDEVDDLHRTDSIVVAHVNIKDKTIGLIFLPRDTRVEIPGYGYDKVNSAYTRGDTPLMVKTLENFLDIEIKYYAILRIDSFVKVIDAIGGVEIDVEKNMRYADRSQKLYINLKKGRRVLDGKRAMHYARFRHDWQGDFGRIERQQKLIRALTKKFFSFDIIKNLPALLAQLQQEQLVVTNFAFSDVTFLIDFLNDEETKRNLRMYSLPSEAHDIRGVSFVIPDYNEIPYMIAGVLKGGFHPDNHLVRIEIANGCGSPGIASLYAQRLSYYGFDILEISNAEHFDFERTTIVVYRKTPFDSRLARMLDADVMRDPTPDTIPHMKIIIGKDKLTSGRPGFGST